MDLEPALGSDPAGAAGGDAGWSPPTQHHGAGREPEPDEGSDSSPTGRSARSGRHCRVVDRCPGGYKLGRTRLREWWDRRRERLRDGPSRTLRDALRRKPHGGWCGGRARRHRAGSVARRLRRRLLPDPLGERHHLTVGRGFQLLLQQHLIHPGMLQRPGAIADRDERFHQPDRHLRVERILGSQLARPLHRRHLVAAFSGPPGQPLECGGVIPSEPRPLLLQPALELRGVGEMEPVQEGADVLRGRPLELARPDSEGERREVAGDQLGVEPQVPGAQEYLVRAHLLAEGVQGLIESLTRPLLIGFRPEHAEQPVACHPLLARSRHQN